MFNRLWAWLRNIFRPSDTTAPARPTITLDGVTPTTITVTAKATD